MTHGPIVHVIAPAVAGGAESVVLSLATDNPDATKVVVLDPRQAPGAAAHPFARRLRECGVHVEELRMGRRRYLEETVRVRSLLRQWNAALVHTHGYHGTMVGGLAAALIRIPRIATVHGYLTRDSKERVYNALDRVILRGFHRVVAVSEPLRSLLVSSGVRSDRVVVVPNGVPVRPDVCGRADARLRLGLSSDDLVVGWVGRFSREKGPDLFVDAMQLTRREFSAVMLGDGPEHERVRRTWDELRAQHSGKGLYFAGEVEGASKYFEAFDILAVTSRSEGMPMVVLEAAAAGVPVVAFGVGGVPDILQDGVGVVVPSGDTLAFAQEMERLLQDAELRSLYATRARDSVSRRFGLEAWRARMRQVYFEIL